jgi:hypothetical protein
MNKEIRDPHVAVGFEIGEIGGMVLIRFQVMPPGETDMTRTAVTQPLAIYPSIASQLAQALEAQAQSLKLAPGIEPANGTH